MAVSFCDNTTLQKELKEILCSYNKPYTRERLIVYKAILKEENQFTASDLLINLENIGRGTTYRTLCLFERIGIIEKVPNIEGKILYKYAL